MKKRKFDIPSWAWIGRIKREYENNTGSIHRSMYEQTSEKDATINQYVLLVQFSTKFYPPKNYYGEDITIS